MTDNKNYNEEEFREAKVETMRKEIELLQKQNILQCEFIEKNNIIEEERKARLEIEKEKARLEIEKEKARLEIENERIKLEVEKAKAKQQKFKTKVKPTIKFKPTNVNNFIDNAKNVFNLNQNQVKELMNIINKEKEEIVEPEREHVDIEPIVEKEDVIIKPIVEQEI